MNPKTEFKNRLCGQFKSLLAVQAGALLLCLAAVSSPAQTYTILHSFGTNVMGLYPHAPLVQGPDGTLYGTTEQGGSANRGQVFKVNPDGSGYTVLKDFTGMDGANPEAGLVLTGTTLYGTTSGGGTNDNGTVFAVNTDGSSFVVLKDFSGDDGANPYAGLVLSGTTLYGTTASGGDNGNGMVFAVNTDGSSFVILKDFTGDDGANPNGSLVLSGTTLYGTTAGGGDNGNGTVFAINTDGSSYTVLKDFTGDDGANPNGSLVLSGTALYGTTQNGGMSGNGAVFSVNTDGSGFAIIKDFMDSIEGANPNGDLLMSGSTMYGTTPGGGFYGNGTVFKVNTDGSAFTVLKDFTNATDGANYYAGLMLSGTTIYGTTYYGGNYNFGTVFKVETDGSGYTILTSFAGGDAANPSGNLLLSGTTIYGTTSAGGSFGNGTVFKVNIDGSGYVILKEFSNIWLEGAMPYGDLVVSETTLFGTANGGSSGNGVVFKVNTDGSGYTVLKDFDGGSDGSNPSGIVLSGTTLYGITSAGGSFGNGTVFRVNTDGSGYTVLKNFAGGDGAYPLGSMVLSGVVLYGATWMGGSYGYGGVFKINTEGSGYAVLNDFTGGEGYPFGSLVLSSTSSSLYGTTAMDGSGNWNGTVFKVNTDGSAYAVLKEFNGYDGTSPRASLVLSGTTLYGATSGGGTVGYGTVFQINTDGSGFAVLKCFTSSDGAYPQAGLVLSGSTLYGTTVNGGGLDSGVLFSLSPGPPTIATSPEDQTTQAGSTVDLIVFATGFPAPTYQWLFNGTNAIDGATNSILELTNVLFSQSGTYFVVVTNSYGSVTGLVATLTVEDPYINNQPYNQSVDAGDTVQFSVDASGTPPLSFQWLKDGVGLNDGGNISGAQTASLAVSSVLGVDAGGYSVVVNNAYGGVTSVVAVLTVSGDPSIVTQPVSQRVGIGQPATFSVGVRGSAPFDYQWRKGGAALPGATNALLTIDPARIADEGFYDVVVSNLYGQVASAVAELTLNRVILDLFHPALTPVSGMTSRAQVIAVQPDGKILVGGRFVPPGGQTSSALVRLNPDGTLDTTFAPMPDGYVYDLVLQPDGKIIVGGYFWMTQGGQTRSCLARLDANGSLDPTFNCSADRGVYCLALQPDGKVLVGGDFAYLGGQDRACIARLNPDGALDASFNPGSTNAVCRLAVQSDGKILVAGTFWWLAGLRCNNLGRLNPEGTLDTMFAPSIYNSVYWLALQPDGKVLVANGMNFMRLNLDGTWDYGFNPVLNNPVSCSTFQPDGKILIGGMFTTAGGALHEYIARLLPNGDVDSAFGAGANNWVQCLLWQPDGSILVAGDFTELCGQPRNFVGRLIECSSPVASTLLQSQTAEAGAGVSFTLQTSGCPPPVCRWFFGTNMLTGGTNACLQLTNIQFDQAGIYTLVLSNIAGVVTSAPVMLNVIPSVERRPVPGVKVMGDVGSSLNVEYTDALRSSANWLPLATVSLTNPPQYCVDASPTLLSQRFYRAWQMGTPSIVPSLNLTFVPAITLTGNIGDTLRLDCINQIGPTDAWVTLDTVTLTNTSQLYFDVSAIGQPQRLYRIVPVP